MKVWVHPPHRRHPAEFPERTSTPSAASDIDACNALPEPRDASDFLYLPAPLASRGLLAALQGAYVPVGPPVYFGALSGAIMQTLQAQTPYASDVGLPYDLGNVLVQARMSHPQHHDPSHCFEGTRDGT